MPMKHVPPGTQKVDYAKEYSNGHKCLTAAQAKALTELMKQEDVKRNTFNLHSDLMVMPRNPLIGEPTPREASGLAIMNPNSAKLLGKVVGGTPILPPGRPVRRYIEPLTPVGKIGIDDRLHDILGNQTANLTAAQPVDLKQFALEQTLRKSGKLNDEIVLKSFKAKAFAKRRQQELDVEITLLKIEQDRKEQELSFLREMYD